MSNLDPLKKPREVGQAHRLGRLLARPAVTPRPLAAFGPGTHALRLGGRRDALLVVPDGLDLDRAAPLAIVFHDAGGTAREAVDLLAAAAAAQGVLLLAPEARGPTWDFILTTFGPDVSFLDEALAETFARLRVDPDRVAAAGFSDGASYALTLGMANGDLFSHVLAFSPGFAAPLSQHGAPRLFVAHGTGDEVLPIDRASRKIVPRLTRAGYAVTYREFVGGHVVPPEIATAALTWMLTTRVVVPH